MHERWLFSNVVMDHPLFSAFSQEHRDYAGGVGKSCCTLLVLATVPVHETSLAGEEGGGM